MKQDSGPDIFRASLAIIGNEILAGRTQDSNTPWIAERLTEHGIVLCEVRIIPDDPDVIVSTVQALSKAYDYVFTTGGIGPTHDDITAECVAKAFGVPLERSDEAFRALEEHYGIEELTPPRAKMSFVPRGARLIPNPVTAAPGFIIENVHVMAGVPRIMQAMLDYVLETIKAGKPILSNTVTCMLPESVLAQDMENLQARYPAIQLGSYPHYRGGTLGLSLVLRGTEPDDLGRATNELIAIIKKHGDEPRALSLRNASNA
jgi:molybdenum cofactor synthesis domain-containing protein